MSISLSALSSVLVEFVNENLIPILDINNVNYVVCMQKWQELTENVMKKISNIRTQDELREKVRTISKMQRNQQLQKQGENNKQNKPLSRQLQEQYSQTQKSSKARQQQQSHQSQWQREQPIKFRDRKISLEDNPIKRNQGSEIIIRKQQRSGSFNVNGLQSDIMIQVPLVLTSGPQVNEKPRISFANNSRKDNEILSFNSISDYHKSRNNIPQKEIKEADSSIPQQQLKMMSKKSIEESFMPSISQTRPNTYSTNYIESIKKINIDSRSPNAKSRGMYSELDTSQDFVETTPLRNESMGGSVLDTIKKRVSDGSEYMGSPNNSGDSFGKFMNSFKKLCNTFESNHQKLLREDFNNKYVNC